MTLPRQETPRRISSVEVSPSELELLGREAFLTAEGSEEGQWTPSEILELERWGDLVEIVQSYTGPSIGMISAEGDVLVFPEREDQILDEGKLFVLVEEDDGARLFKFGDIKDGKITNIDERAIKLTYSHVFQVPVEEKDPPFLITLETPYGPYSPMKGRRRPSRETLMDFASEELKDNPYSVAELFRANQKKTLGQRFVKTVDYFKKKPALMAATTVVAIFLAYKAIKYIQNLRSKRFRAVEIKEKLLYFPGEDQYEMSAIDAQWLANVLWAYIGTNPDFWATKKGQETGSAVLWTLVNRFMTCVGMRAQHKTIAEMIATELPAAGSHAIDWDFMPFSMKKLIKDFMVGFIPNNVGTRTSFTGHSYRYMPGDSMRVGPVVVWTDPGAAIRPDARA